MNIATSPDGGTFEGAVDLLYRSFDDVAFRADMPRCAHCVGDDDVAALRTDVRDLEPALVARFVTKAGTTWGDSVDLRRIAPRALHLAAEHSLPVSRAVVLDKLVSADWANWPPRQVDAVRRFLLAEWRRLLLSPPRTGHAAHRWLRQTATAESDLGPFLDLWQQELAADAGAAPVHLAVMLVNSELRPDFPATVTDLFDQPDPERGWVRAGTTAEDLAGQLDAWLAAPVTEANLARAASALSDTADARRLGLAVERLRRYRTARARSL